MKVLCTWSFLGGKNPGDIVVCSPETRPLEKLGRTPCKGNRTGGPFDRITLDRFVPNEDKVIDTTSFKIGQVGQANTLEHCSAIT